MAGKKNGVSIWRVRGIEGVKPTEIIRQIVHNHNSDLSDELDAQKLHKVCDVATSVDGYRSILYAKRRKTEGIFPFIAQNINYEGTRSDEAIRDKVAAELRYSVVDTVLFIYRRDALYAVTTASGHHIVKDYADDDFPMEVAVRILSGELQSSRSRMLSGATYSETKVYRRAYSISDSEAFGKIWKDLVGHIDSTTVKDYPLLKDFVSGRGSTRADIRSSFTLAKTISPAELFKLIDEIHRLHQMSLTDERRRIFSFVESTKPVKSRIEQDKLTDELLKQLRNDIRSGDPAGGFDVCHPDEVEKFFLNMYAYFYCERSLHRFADDSEYGRLDYASLVWALHQTGLKSGKMSFDNFKKKILGLKIGFSVNDDEPEIKTDLLRYLHGEITVGGSTYFMIDGRWYEAPGQFLDKLAEFFRQDIVDHGLLIENIPFVDYPLPDPAVTRDYREGRFNVMQSRQPDFYYGDKISAWYKNAPIELFDLLWISDGVTYVIQVKNEFAGGMRDAMSQITMSARALRDTGRESMLAAYYDKWASLGHDKNLSKEGFIDLFNRKVVFVVASAHKYEFTVANLMDSSKFSSHIAKFEVHQAWKEFHSEDWELRLARVKKD